MILQNGAYTEGGNGNGTGSYSGVAGATSSNFDYIAFGAYEGTQGLPAEGTGFASLSDYQAFVDDLLAKTTEISSEQVIITLTDIHKGYVGLGGSTDDVITADASDEGAGLLWGRAGDDSLTGGAGVDTLLGQGGDDILTTSGDGDRLSGAGGADHFVFTDLSATKSAIIQNLTDADVIDFSAIDPDAVTGGDQAFSLVTHFSSVAGEMKLVYDAAHDRTSLKIDLDGDGHTDHTVRLSGGDHTDFDNFVV